MVKRILLGSAATVMGLSMVVGVVSATPQGKNDKGKSGNTNVTITTDVNNVGVFNGNLQLGASGSVLLFGNTKGGDVKTGNVTNNNSTTTTITITNNN